MICKFEELYQQEAQGQRARYQALREGFKAQFGSDEGGEYFSAPGRSEIGGNHTDHQHGRVLAAAVNLDIAAYARKTDNGRAVLKSAEYTKMDDIDISDLDMKEEEKDTSAALLRGICARCVQLGYKVGGFEAYTITRVLKGSGLSSSAAFEVLVVTIISHLYNDDAIDPVTVAKIAQYAENVYFGKPSGLLDQTASSVGGFTAIDFKDPENILIEKVNFDVTAHGYALCVVDTGGNHADLTNEYALVPKEMKEVAAFFGKEFLRDVDEQEFYDKIGEVRKQTGDRAVLRAMHFFDDDRLAAQEAQALRAGDFDSFKEMVIASGRSSFQRLQNVFATINPQEQGLSLALALTEKLLAGEGAWRVHGGGFAGTIQAYVPLARLDEYRAAMEKVFGEGACYVLSVRQAGSTKVEL